MTCTSVPGVRGERRESSPPPPPPPPLVRGSEELSDPSEALKNGRNTDNGAMRCSYGMGNEEEEEEDDGVAMLTEDEGGSLSAVAESDVTGTASWVP